MDLAALQQMRTKRRMSRSDQTELLFENPPEQSAG